MLPSLTVECGNSTCKYAGKRRRVHLRPVAPGVLEMPRLVCAGCGLDMPTVTPWPPVPDEEDTTMPKITVHGGPTNEYAFVGEHGPELVVLPADGTPVFPGADDARVGAEDTEGSEDLSAGTSSSTSSEKARSSTEQSETPAPSRARTTGSRSKPARTERDGTAGSTATGGPKTAGSDK